MIPAVELGAARVWCTHRGGGVSASPYDSLNLGDHVGDQPHSVATNRERLAGTLGLVPATAWVWLRQVHGATVHVATGPTGPPAPEADAAVTATRGLPLAILTADCAPVALACDDAAGVVHAGHRGLVAGVVQATVAALREIGHGPVRAYLGPCIRPAHYEFGAVDLARVSAHFGTGVVSHTDDGRPALDIPAAVRIALERAGADELDDSNADTFTSPHLYSYRRDGVTGRQATIVVLE